MARVRLILEDHNGIQTEQTFALAGDLDTLDGIDEAVEAFRLQALPQVEKSLLEAAQERAIPEKKRRHGA